MHFWLMQPRKGETQIGCDLKITVTSEIAAEEVAAEIVTGVHSNLILFTCRILLICYHDNCTFASKYVLDIGLQTCVKWHAHCTVDTHTHPAVMLQLHVNCQEVSICHCRAQDADGRDDRHHDRDRDRDRRSNRDRDSDKKRRRSTSREKPSKASRDGVKSRKADASDPDIIEANAERARLGLKPLK